MVKGTILRKIMSDNSIWLVIQKNALNAQKLKDFLGEAIDLMEYDIEKALMGQESNEFKKEGIPIKVISQDQTINVIIPNTENTPKIVNKFLRFFQWKQNRNA